jgi:FKBP-type peptidyl-prolyl cis-trans isomerase
METLLPKGGAEAIHFHEGDSVSMVARARHIPWAAIGAERGALADTGWIDLELSLFALRSREESRQLAEAARTARTAADEDSTLTRFFAGETDPWQRFMGVYFQLDRKNPRRPAIQSGQTVTIAYTARFLEGGKVFDDTHTSQQPLTFRLGDPGQVIKGLEIAVHLLPKKGRGRFVIPSDLAFGAEGSSSRIVPPWTPVLFEVEVTEAADVASPAVLMDSSAAPL